MRISDLMMTTGFLNNVSKTKKNIDKLNSQILTEKKVLKASDNPSSASKILRLGVQLSRNQSYKSNITSGLSHLKETTFALESVQSEVSDVLTKLTELNNQTNTDNYKTYAEQIDLSLKTIVDLANSESDGQFIFGGTDFSGKPYGFSSDALSIESKVDTGGNQNVKISSNMTQKMNLSGTEVFGTLLGVSGNLDRSMVVGDSYTTTGTVYNASKEAYTVSMTYTKTADNQYSMTYDVLDSTSTSIYSTPPAAVQVAFDPASGDLASINGVGTDYFSIKDSAHHLDFSLDLGKFDEADAASSSTTSLNQTSDVFNTLMRIRDNLNSGIKPSADDEQLLKDFNSRMLDNITKTGNIINRLEDTDDLLASQKTVYEDLYSSEQKVDVAQAIVDMQSLEYSLEMAYKISSSVMTKSLLDYL